MEQSFFNLADTLIGLYRHVLYREFFFTHINSYFETVVYNPLSTSIAIPKHHREPVKKAKLEEVKMEDRLEKALEMAKKAITDLNIKSDIKVKPAAKKPVPVKQPKQIKKVTKPEPEKPLPNVIEASGITVNQDLLQRVRDLKISHLKELRDMKPKLEKIQQDESVARRTFLDSIRQKFPKKCIVTPLDRKISKVYASFKLLKEIKSIVTDFEIVESLNDIANLPLQSSYGQEEVKQIFKAYFIMEWISNQMKSLEEKKDTSDLSNALESLNLAISYKMSDATPIKSFEHFKSERKLLSVLTRCGEAEANELILKYRAIDEFRAKAEVVKFCLTEGEEIHSMKGLQTLHSLICKRGRSICTFVPVG